jgi:uncharacterized membrane protein YfcA
MTFAICILGGLLTGLLSGLLGVGGGIIIIPFLLYTLKLKLSEAIATSLAIIIPISFMGAYLKQHFYNININFKIFVLFAIFGMIGSYAGVYLSDKCPVGILKKVFAGLLVIIALKIFLE